MNNVENDNVYPEIPPLFEIKERRKMTVGELISALKEYPLDSVIHINISNKLNQFLETKDVSSITEMNENKIHPVLNIDKIIKGENNIENGRGIQMADKPKFDVNEKSKNLIKKNDSAQEASEKAFTAILDKPHELVYGIVREYSNGTTLWFEPITDELDGFVLRKSGGSIQTVFSEDRDAYIADMNDPNIVAVYGQKKQD